VHLPDLMEEQFHRPVGTTEYMAPEQLLRVRSDKRSDIFALGAILYQLATGRLPFGIPARMRKVRRRVWRDPVPPRALRPKIPPVLQEIILRCLEPVPDARYARAEDLMFDLRHLDLAVLTERAERMQQSDFRTTFARRLRTPKTLGEIFASATKSPPRAPIILVAVSLRPGLEEVRQALLEASVTVLANMPGTRLACVNVVPTSLIAVEPMFALRSS
jgi:serine/threonine protein kinase